jgi:DNA-3-methyladenine glycosylase II
VALLRLPQPYDFELSTERFRIFGPDLANLWHDDALHRVVEGREIQIRAEAGGVQVTPAGQRASRVVEKLLGAEFDLVAFTAFATDDPVLARVEPALRGLRPPLAPDPFESLVTSITAQQVSLFAAFAVRNRLIARFGVQADDAYAFPTAERLAGAREDELVGVGFSRRKATYVLALARADLDFASLTALPDDEVKEQLQLLPGIGEWTADWFLARYLARPHAWPAGDLGLRKAVSAFYAAGRPLSTEEVRAMGTRFHPLQNLAAHYLLTGARRLL